ncbi:MAG TPA: hypothetical protein PL064_13830, partial [Thermogutta sp.]|nr:hypothetical protein [Thermogutta sp.]
WQIVQYLLVRGQPLINRDDVRASFARHQGNLREMLFDLYDLYEVRRTSEVDSLGVVQASESSSEQEHS